ncbi:hypothetical protein HX862_13595 [Pseudomonas sp. D5002]|uniref:hypothetical protein n=1 Tax=Pseudomonas sp. D5002 TaxID=2738818 RepID=UPI0015A3A35B|nr:hypothetical protein [Pseudomonas sp. D5002]NWB08940.1 hypothetical protein [Pseudomonas sp. D5002]
MSRYEELCRSYEDQDKAAIQYWQALQLKAVQIANGLRVYLEYPEKDYLGLDGVSKLPYVYVTNRGEKEEVSHFTELKGDRGAIDFDILITLEVAAGVFPKNLLRISMHIGSVDGLLRVWSDNPAIKADIVPSQPSSYDALYEQIFEALRTHLSDRPQLQ